MFRNWSNQKPNPALKTKIIIRKAQGVPQQNNEAHPKHPERERKPLQTETT